MENGLKMKYFVLKPKGEDIYAEASRRAIREYAKIIERENPELCNDLRNWVDNIHLANLKKQGIINPDAPVDNGNRDVR